jgi:hypothetical protein
VTARRPNATPSASARAVACFIPLWALCLLVGAGSLAAPPLPHTLGVEVVWGDERGAESLREELAIELVTGVRRARCFRAVCSGTCADEGGTQLRVRWIVDRLEETTEHDASLAQHHSPLGMPGAAPGVVARIRLEGRMVIEALDPEALTLRDRAVRLEPSHRPLRLEEDARDAVRRELMAAAVQTTVGAMCGDSERKWARRIDQAKARRASRSSR